MHHALRLIALVLTLLTALHIPALSAEGPEPPNERDAWSDVERSAGCEDRESPRCEELRLKHFCRFQGSSSHNAVRCAGGRRVKVEHELNRRYRRLLQGLTKVAKEEKTWAEAPAMLVESQRAWLIAREKECALVAESFNTGALQPAIAEDCMREEAERRLASLGRHAKLFGLPR